MIDNIIALRPQRMTYPILQELDARGVIRLFKPTERIRSNPYADAVDTLYSTASEYDGHKLICVRKAETRVTFTVHSASEEVLFINPAHSRARALFLVLAIHPVDLFIRKVEEGTLDSTDIVALQVDYTNVQCSAFSIPEYTPHCELTHPGEGEAPLFYVTEPTNMTMEQIDTGKTVFEIDYEAGELRV